MTRGGARAPARASGIVIRTPIGVDVMRSHAISCGAQSEAKETQRLTEGVPVLGTAMTRGDDPWRCPCARTRKGHSN